MNIQANDSMGTAPPAPSPGAGITSPGSFASVARSQPKTSDANIFRDAWLYRITGNGKARLDSRSGASPAFLSVLDIAALGPVSFRDIARRFENIASDDLELWLSAMCSMDLLEPVAALVSADDSTEVALAGPESAAIIAIEPVRRPVALLVHRDPVTRASWRRSLKRCGHELFEATDLDTVEVLMQRHRPAWVVLGLVGEDFDGLHVLRALKRPRASRRVRVCLVLPHSSALCRDAHATAVRADAIATTGIEIARALNPAGEDSAGPVNATTTLSPDCALPAARQADEKRPVLQKSDILLKTARMNAWMSSQRAA